MTSKHYFLAVILVFFLAPSPSYGQNNRLNTSNQIGWYTYFGTFKPVSDTHLTLPTKRIV